MPGARRALRAVGAAGFLAVAATGACVFAAAPNATPSAAATATHVGTYVWDLPPEDFGGFSAIELSADGARYTALSDRATLRWGSVHRDSQGRIRELTVAGTSQLRDTRGKPLPPGWIGDSEGMATDAQGRIWVSFEGMVRIARFDTPDAPSQPVEGDPAFRSLKRNTALEALAVLPDGSLLTIPEAPPEGMDAYPVWLRRGDRWSMPWTIPRDGPYAPVGADVGPDGKLYLLERDFKGVLGFASRVRRFDLGDVGDRGDGGDGGGTLAHDIGAGETMLTTGYLQYDNLEGISVWQDGRGIRLTMISDDNFMFLQRTELVEYRVTE